MHLLQVQHWSKSWAQQAQLAADGKMDEFVQVELNGGKAV
jgi:hypothetical protein